MPRPASGDQRADDRATGDRRHEQEIKNDRGGARRRDHDRPEHESRVKAHAGPCQPAGDTRVPPDRTISLDAACVMRRA
jgi:hypothetical protein